MALIPTIIAGGSGTRLWPLSRQMFPKQFVALTSKQSMLAETIDRLSNIDHDKVYLVGNLDHEFLLSSAADSMEINRTIFLEPCKRNTAPAIALAALYADPMDILFILPADQVILDGQAFCDSVRRAFDLAELDHLVTMGITPKFPHTGYGYIRAGEPEGEGFKIAEFVEKPDLTTAENYVTTGDYYWNSGMFLFKAARYLSELREFRPEILEACQKAYELSTNKENVIKVDKAEFEKCPSESIDYAVMENTKDAVMVGLDANWDDVGSWKSLRDIQAQDASGNVVTGDVVTSNTRNSYIRASEKLVVALGLDNQIVIDTKDALLVADVADEQQLAAIVKELEVTHNQQTVEHREVQRPWGTYDSVDVGEHHQVKRIKVNPGARLSRQSHEKRDEHWIVVKGKAEVYKDGEVSILSENESTFLPKGCVHSLGNRETTTLEIVEVQYGSYLGEDDIVRYDDLYGRVPDDQ